jgi:hypothetical protein
MKTITVLYKGEPHEVLVDNDFELDKKLYIIKDNKSGYKRVAFKIGSGRKGTKNVYLHRHIMGAQKGDVVDHKDGNPLNNQKSNLRFTTKEQNGKNQKGKGYTKRKDKFIAQIMVDGQQKYLGIYSTEEEAREAYKQASLEHFGEFSRFNS